MDIVDLDPEDHRAIEQSAALLVDFWPYQAAAWPDIDDAFAEVEESLEEDRIALVAMDDTGEVIGYIAAAAQYAHAWELHPLVVKRSAQGQGVGTALVAELEARIAEEDGLTLYLGADDLDESTSVGGEELFPGVLALAEEVKPTDRRHSLGFWRRLGFEVVGLIPDANGPGRPDIWMAKPIEPLAEEEPAVEPVEPVEPLEPADTDDQRR